jgi:hypothetical protein
MAARPAAAHRRVRLTGATAMACSQQRPSRRGLPCQRSSGEETNKNGTSGESWRPGADQPNEPLAWQPWGGSSGLVPKMRKCSEARSLAFVPGWRPPAATRGLPVGRVVSATREQPATLPAGFRWVEVDTPNLLAVSTKEKRLTWRRFKGRCVGPNLDRNLGLAWG